jgi:hypothetical protein
MKYIVLLTLIFFSNFASAYDEGINAEALATSPDVSLEAPVMSESIELPAAPDVSVETPSMPESMELPAAQDLDSSPSYNSGGSYDNSSDIGSSVESPAAISPLDPGMDY